MPSTTSSVRLFAVVLLSLAAVGTVSSTTIITNTSQTCLDYLLATQSLLKVAKNAGVLTTFFNQLSSSSVTGISPSSKTISGIAPQLLNDPTYAENLLNLHIFPNANFSGFSSSGSDTVLTSALNIPSTVNHTYELLGQYGGQRVKFYQNSTDGNLYVQSGIQYAVVNSTFIGSNGVIHNIGPILYPPGNDTTILTALNAASTSNGNPVSVFLSNYLSYVRSAINGTQGYTL